MRLRQIAADLLQAALLRAGQAKRQAGEQLARQLRGRRERAGAGGLPPAMVQTHGQLLCQQLVELDAPPGRMRALLQRCG